MELEVEVDALLGLRIGLEANSGLRSNRQTDIDSAVDACLTLARELEQLSGYKSFGIRFGHSDEPPVPVGIREEDHLSIGRNRDLALLAGPECLKGVENHSVCGVDVVLVVRGVT